MIDAGPCDLLRQEQTFQKHRRFLKAERWRGSSPNMEVTVFASRCRNAWIGTTWPWHASCHDIADSRSPWQPLSQIKGRSKTSRHWKHGTQLSHTVKDIRLGTICILSVQTKFNDHSNMQMTSSDVLKHNVSTHHSQQKRQRQARPWWMKLLSPEQRLVQLQSLRTHLQPQWHAE